MRAHFPVRSLDGTFVEAVDTLVRFADLEAERPREATALSVAAGAVAGYPLEIVAADEASASRVRDRALAYLRHFADASGQDVGEAIAAVEHAALKDPDAP